jgi:ribosomal protein S12 methylthiotransferase accessory factor
MVQSRSCPSAARWSSVDAAEKAFLEAAQGLTYVRRLLRRYQDWEAAVDYGDVDEFTKHAIFYSKYPELREKVGYLVHPLRPTPCTRPQRALDDAPADIETTLSAIVRELDCAGYRYTSSI